MIKYNSLILFLVLSIAHGWTTAKMKFHRLHSLHMAEDLTESENPCWQDIYDDDCSMSSVYAASFVASKWIKSLPCAAGIEDCDMPQDLNLPNVHQDSGIDHVDVMGFLNLKRAESVDKKSNGSDKAAP